MYDAPIPKRALPVLRPTETEELLKEYCAAAAPGRQVDASPIRKAVRISLATMSSLGDPVLVNCIGRVIGSPRAETYICCGQMAIRTCVAHAGLSSHEDGLGSVT